MQSLEGVQLWLAGEGDLSQQLREECRDIGPGKASAVSGLCIAPGFSRTDPPRPALASTCWKTEASIITTPWPNKAFDYVQAGVPALHMDFPEYWQLNAEYETSLLLADLTPQSIAAAIRTLLDDIALYQRLENKLPPRGPGMGMEKEEKKLVDFYRGVFAETG